MEEGGKGGKEEMKRKMMTKKRQKIYKRRWKRFSHERISDLLLFFFVFRQTGDLNPRHVS